MISPGSQGTSLSLSTPLLFTDPNSVGSHYNILSFDDQATEQMRTAYLIFQGLLATAATYCSRKTETFPTATNFYQQVGPGLNDFRDIKARLVDAVWDHQIQADTNAKRRYYTDPL